MPGACSVGGAAAAEECWKPSDRTKWGWRTGLEFMTMEMCAIRQHPGHFLPFSFPSAYHQPHPLYYFYETEPVLLHKIIQGEKGETITNMKIKFIT